MTDRYDAQVEIRDDFSRRKVDIFIYWFVANKINMMKNDGSTEIIEESAGSSPTFSFDRGVLRPLCDALLKHGVRPKEASHTEGKLEATEKHLEDMRKIALHQYA